MPAVKQVWGIDVGQSALRGIKLRLLDGSAEVVAFDVVEYPMILSQPEADAERLLAEAIEKFVSRNDLSGSDVVLAVPGQQTFMRFSKLPPVDPKKINSIVQYEAQQQIPFDIDEVIWDYQVFSSPDTPEVEVGIFAIRRDLMHRYLSPFLARGIEPVVVQASPLALYNFLAFDDPPTEGATVILDVGAQNTDLVIVRPNGVWTRNIPLGGNNFTEALARSFKLSFSKAESLKQTAATSKYARQIFQAMRPVFADLVAEIQRSLGYYNSTHRDVQLTRVVGMGNAFKLPGLQKYLQQNLQIEVDRLSGFKKLQLGPGVNASVFSEHVMSLGVAYGLAVQGLGLASINSSLLPVEVVRSLVWRRKKPWFAAAAAVLALAAGAMWYSQVRYASALAASRGQAERIGSVPVQQAVEIVQRGVTGRPPRESAKMILAAAQALRSEYQSKVSQAAGGADQVQRILELFKDRGLWLELLYDIHSTLPKPWPELANAKTVEEYVAALKKYPRHQRKLIFIDNFDAAYSEDVLNAFVMGAVRAAGRDRGDFGRGMAPAQAAEPQVKGFLITLYGRTPYGQNIAETVRFLTDEWVSRLKQVKGTKHKFYIAKVEEPPRVVPWNKMTEISGLDLAMWYPQDSPLTSTRRRSGSGLRLGGIARAPVYDRGGGRGGDRFGAMDRGADRGGEYTGPGGGGYTRAPAFTPVPRSSGRGEMPIDPLTGERTDLDYVFALKIAVVLGEPGQSPAAGAVSPAAARPRY